MKLLDAEPVPLPRAYLGRRSLRPLYQWEGVVEQVSESGFRARLVPFEGNRPNLGRVEFSDFDYEDLADETDVERVTEGAIFYWTVGRHRNPAGTQTNVSLVRFRRLPAPSLLKKHEALDEARSLLATLGGESST